jgi:hypothetical protein
MNFKLTGTRLFTFGCSFTQYIWPTYADILGKHFNFFENWALAGAGNLYIFNSIVEAHKRNKFNKNDTIVVMWSGLTRVDYYNQNSWQPQGGNFEFKTNDSNGYEIINYAYIECIRTLFDSLDLNYKMICLSLYPKQGQAYDLYKNSIDLLDIFPYNSSNRSIKVDTNNLKNTFYYDLMKNAYARNAGVDWPNFDEYFNGKATTNEKIKKEIDSCLGEFIKGFNHLQTDVKLYDSHPTPKEHLKAITKLFPGFVATASTLEWIQEWDNTVLTGTIVPYSTNAPKNRL